MKLFKTLLLLFLSTHLFCQSSTNISGLSINGEINIGQSFTVINNGQGEYTFNDLYDDTYLKLEVKYKDKDRKIGNHMYNRYEVKVLNSSNYLNMKSDPDWVLLISKDDRRYFIFNDYNPKNCYQFGLSNYEPISKLLPNKF